MKALRLPKLLAAAAIAVAACSVPAIAEDRPNYETHGYAETPAHIAVEIELHASVPNPIKDHEYTFSYQFRVHTKKGEVGPILGNRESPNGAAFDLGPLDVFHREPSRPFAAGHDQPTPREMGLYDHQPRGEFRKTFDVSRTTLSQMTHLPNPQQNVVIRVEPHIFDKTAKTFLTPARPGAVLLVIDSRDDGTVTRLDTFADWFAQQFHNETEAQAALKLAADMDAADQVGLAFGFEKVFIAKGVTPELKALAVREMPVQLLDVPSNNGHKQDETGYHDKGIRGVLEDLTKLPATTPVLKAAIAKTLAENRR